jgi:preprotein translocase subunit YajC
MFISEALAQTAGGASTDSLVSFLPLVAIVVVFYFMLFRPQQQKAKKHKELLAGIRRGDRVVTAGGIIGTVNKVLSDTELQVEIAEGVRVRLLRGTVTEILAKTEPAKDKAGKSAEAADAEVEDKAN